MSDDTTIPRRDFDCFVCQRRLWCDEPIWSTEDGRWICVKCVSDDRTGLTYHAPNLGPKPSPESVLTEAARLVDGDRRQSYGPVEKSFAKIATVWSVVLGVEVTPCQVALCMAGLKLCREANAHKRDNLVDLAAYAHLAQVVCGEK